MGQIFQTVISRTIDGRRCIAIYEVVLPTGSIARTLSVNADVCPDEVRCDVVDADGKITLIDLPLQSLDPLHDFE